MRSVTLSSSRYFSLAMYLQTLKMYGPIWILHGIIWFFNIPLQILKYESGYYGVTVDQLVLNYPNSLATTGLVVSILFGLFSAMCGFRYLYESRSVNMVHSLPTRREGLFLTQYLAGLSFLVIPNLFNLVCSVLALMSQGGSAYSLLVFFFWHQTLSSVFFYHFGVFCGMFTGSMAALPLFYAIFNGVVYFVSLLMEPIFAIYLVGFQSLNFSSSALVHYLTPTYALYNAFRTYVSYENLTSELSSVATVYAYTAVGFLLVLVSFFLFRARHLERAGDAVSVKCMRPVFRFCVSLIGGVAAAVMSVNMLYYAASDQTIALALLLFSLFWGILAYFVAEMILQKTFRVLKIWKQSLVMGGAIIALFGGLALDVFGFESYIPKPNEISHISVYNSAVLPQDSLRNTTLVLDPEHFELVTDLHTYALAAARNDQYASDTLTTVSFQYTLQSGKSVTRSYHFNFGSQTEDLISSMEALHYNREIAYDSYRFDAIPRTGTTVVLGDLCDPTQVASTASIRLTNAVIEGHTAELLEALALDFAAGTIGMVQLATEENSAYQLDAYYINYLRFEWYSENLEGYHRYQSTNFALTPDAVHTLAVLEKYDIINESNLLFTHSQLNQFLNSYTTS